MSTEQRAAIARIKFQFGVNKSEVNRAMAGYGVHDEKSFREFYEAVMKREVVIERKLQ